MKHESRWLRAAAAALPTAALLAAGCAVAPVRIAVDVASADDLSQVARLTEDRDHPIMLRDVDGKVIDAFRFGPPLRNHEFAVTPGRHVLRVTSPPAVLGGTPIPVGSMRCHVIEADLAAGRLYRLREEAASKAALLLLEGPGQVVARGTQVDEFWTGTRTCRWP